MILSVTTPETRTAAAKPPAMTAARIISLTPTGDRSDIGFKSKYSLVGGFVLTAERISSQVGSIAVGHDGDDCRELGSLLNRSERDKRIDVCTSKIEDGEIATRHQVEV